jgi:hypothetical protein
MFISGPLNTVSIRRKTFALSNARGSSAFCWSVSSP